MSGCSCLIQSIEGTHAVVELGGVKRTISLMLTPEAEVGNYVLVHAGYAIGIVDEEAGEGNTPSAWKRWQPSPIRMTREGHPSPAIAGTLNELGSP